MLKQNQILLLKLSEPIFHRDNISDPRVGMMENVAFLSVHKKFIKIIGIHIAFSIDFEYNRQAWLNIARKLEVAGRTKTLPGNFNGA